MIGAGRAPRPRRKNHGKNFDPSVKTIVGLERPTRCRKPTNSGNTMTLKPTTLVFTAAVLGLTTSVAMAQTATQSNGTPREKVEKFVNQYGLTLPPPPPTPPAAPVSTTTVTSPPAPPPKKR
jgi:hypothetical protein